MSKEMIHLNDICDKGWDLPVNTNDYKLSAKLTALKNGIGPASAVGFGEPHVFG